MYTRSELRVKSLNVRSFTTTAFAARLGLGLALTLVCMPAHFRNTLYVLDRYK